MNELFIKLLKFRIVGIGAVKQIAGLEERKVKKMKLEGERGVVKRFPAPLFNIQ